MTRVLKPGGTLAVSIPRQWPEAVCWHLSDEYFNANQGHIRIYKKQELINKVTAWGFRLTGVHYAHSLHAPFWWLKCLVGHERRDSSAVNLYHRFLVWDMMRRPALTRALEHLLNPVLGKSVVVYLKKGTGNR